MKCAEIADTSQRNSLKDNKENGQEILAQPT